jgi:hypothetical protein
VVKQVYRVKYDGRKKKSSDLNSTIKKPITLLKNPTIDGKEVGKSSINIIGAKSEPKEGESAQNQERFAAVQNKNKIDMLNRFTKVARKKLQKFSAEKLKEKGLGGFLNKEFKLRRMMLKQVVQQRHHTYFAFAYVEFIPWYAWFSLSSLF